MLGLRSSTIPFKYLGVKILSIGKKAEALEEITTKIRGKFEGWNLERKNTFTSWLIVPNQICDIIVHWKITAIIADHNATRADFIQFITKKQKIHESANKFAHNLAKEGA